MKPELLQAVSNVMIFIGAVLAAIGGFGSQYFSKQIANRDKIENKKSEKELKSNINELLQGNEILKERLIPFEKLASEIHPTLKLDSALIQLQEDFKRLEEITSKYEFIPLNDDVKVSVLQKLRPIAKRFSERQFEIEITHETWVNAPTQKYTLQLKSLLEKAGFKVLGPRQITVFLVQRSYPVELGFSPSMAVEANGFLEALLPIFTSTNGWSKRDFQEERKTLRFHIGGGAIFKKNGVVTIE